MSLPGVSIREIRSVNALTIATDDVAPEERASASSSAVASYSSVPESDMILLDDAEANTGYFVDRRVSRRVPACPLEDARRR